MLNRTTLLSLTGTLLLSGCNFPPPEPEDRGTPQPYKTGDVVEMDAVTLMGEARENADAATAHYREATMRVCGQVHKVDHPDRSDRTIVQLEDRFINNVLIPFDKGTPWKDIKVGEQRSFECPKMGAHLVTVSFDGKLRVARR